VKKRKRKKNFKKSPHSSERSSGIKGCEEGSVRWHPGWVREGEALEMEGS